jgi:putative tryptophan/tyrosine transport system substrate-binding protein
MTTVSGQRLAVTSKTGANPMFRSIVICLLLNVLLFAISPAGAQQPKKVPRIGILSSGSTSSSKEVIEPLQLGLRDLGYIEGQNITTEYRYAEGVAERLPNLAAELVQLKVDIIVVSGSPSTQAAMNATKTIPIVMTNANDPVGIGLVASLAHPGGNVTGLSNVGSDLGGKQLELLKEASPKVSRVAVLSDSAIPGNALWLGEMKVAAEALRITLQPVNVHRPDDFERAFSAIKKEHASALSTLRNGVNNNYRARIVDFAAKSRLPAMYPDREYVEVGGLMSYGPNFPDLFRRAATYVDKILKGVKPADLPVEQPTKFEFVINLKTAKALNLTIPQSVLFRADKVVK